MHFKLTTTFVLLAGLILLAVPNVLGFDFTELEKSVSEYKLDNGLTILVMERHDAPVASFITYVNVGSSDDPKGQTGLAHMFEHMAFKGTTTLGTEDIKTEMKLIAAEDSAFLALRRERMRGLLADSAKLVHLDSVYRAAIDTAYELVVPNELGNVVDREGGVGLNAFTSLDETVYMMNFPSNKVELWMALESERWLNPVLREMYKEREVVAEERRMRTESSPIGRAVEEMLCMSYKAHPYGIPTIGHMVDIQNYSRGEAKKFFETFYIPANMVIAVVGDVNAKDVYTLAKKYFGRLPYKPLPERLVSTEPEQLGERRMVMEDPAQPFYAAGWHVPEGTHPDNAALYALADYLGQGRTSTIYKNLVKEKKAAFQVGTFVGFPGVKYANMFLCYAMPAAGHTNEEMEREILAEIEKVKDQPITQEELEKIKARTKAGFINQLDDNSGLAMQLAAYQTRWGNWRQMFKELDRINAVTVEDIQRVAQQYLTDKNRNVVMMNTKSEEGA